MADRVVEQTEQKPVKRFTSYEEFLKEFYPRSTEQENREKAEEDQEFGVELALDSLNRHGNILRLANV